MHSFEQLKSRFQLLLNIRQQIPEIMAQSLLLLSLYKDFWHHLTLQQLHSLYLVAYFDLLFHHTVHLYVL